MSRQPSLPTVKKLFALSGNNCAFPGCSTAMIDPEHGTVIGEICHIKAREEGGPRFDHNQTDDERQGFANLVLMCGVHHKIIDTDVDSYPVEILKAIKAEHEAKHRNGLPPSDEVAEKILGTLSISGSIITTQNQSGGQVAHSITNIFAHPPKPPASLSPVVQALLTKVDHQAELDYYDFRIELRNDGPKTVREFRVEVEISKRYLEGMGGFAAEVPSRNQDTRLFRHTQKNFGRDFTLYAGEKYPVFALSFILKKQHYLQGITESIKVYVYSEEEMVSTKEYPIAEMLNAERVEVILGPRRAALRKIYQAALAFYGADADLTDSPIFISEEPSEGKRNVYIQNAYNMAKVLTKEGSLVFDNEDALIVRLTDEGIRKAS